MIGIKHEATVNKLLMRISELDAFVDALAGPGRDEYG
jgi:hypothetical protein